MAVANTPTYYDTRALTAVKSIMVLAPGYFLPPKAEYLGNISEL